MSFVALLGTILPRALTIALAVTAVGAGVAGTVFLVRTPVQEAAPPAALPIARPVSVPDAFAPSFDVVRVGPTGTVVMAGRAEPGVSVIVRDGNTVLGVARADGRGEWVLAPNAPLQAGGRELTLTARGADGRDVAGAGSVLLSVPERGAAVAPVAVMVPQSGPARVLGAPATPLGTRLALDTVDYDDQGTLRFSGTAPPGASVRVYVDDKPSGDALADARGQWTLTPSGAVAGGVHKLRVDQLGAGGKVSARVELPFERSTLPASQLAGGRVVVQPGETLWRLARGAYGDGMRYKVIYLANKDQIRNPGLIYPGQAFAVPTP